MRFTLLPAGAFLLALHDVYASKPWQTLSPLGFVLSQTSYNDVIFALDAKLPITSVESVLYDGNHEIGYNEAKDAWQWPDDDNGAQSWYPQGISSTSDASFSGTYNGTRAFLVSWFAQPELSQGVRISFINRDASPWSYRHVLLVEPVQSGSNPTFRPVKVHAGGIMWYGNMLYVADTNYGVRLFDMNHIYQVDTSAGSVSKIGRQKGGIYQAYGYKYVLPQCRRYLSKSRPTGQPFHFSYMSLDRTNQQNSFLVGEYTPKATARVARFSLDADTALPVTNADGDAIATEAYHHGYREIQGIVSLYGQYYLTETHGINSNGDLIEYACYHQVNNRARQTGSPCEPLAVYNQSGLYIPGPEDLTYDYQAGFIWTLTEFPGNRYLITTQVLFPELKER